MPRGEFAGLANITITNIITAGVTLILIIAALVFFFILIWGGIDYISSGGDKGRTEQARAKITSALIGIVLVFGAWAMISLIRGFFGVDILQLNIPNAQQQN